MDKTNKKMAAALAAVNAYLQEEEAHYQQTVASQASMQQPAQQQSVWSLAGRQDMMTMRNLIQMKAFSRF